MTGTDQARRLTDRIDDTEVVDCDVHVMMKSESLRRKRAAHLTEPYRKLLTSDAIGANPYAQSAFPMTIPDKLNVASKSVESPADVRNPLMTDFGVDRAVVNTLLKLDIIPDSERAFQEMRATNDVLLDVFLDGNDDLYGLCSVTTRRPDKAAEEIDRMGSERDVVGLLLVDGASEKPLGDSRYDEIYQAAEDNEMPVVFHTATGPLPHMDNFPLQPLDFEQYMQIHSLVHPFAHMQTFTSLLTTGTPEKFPDLEFVFLEAGLGWIPYMMYRLNREYQERRMEAPLLQKSPEAYVRDQFYFGTQPLEEPANPAYLTEIIDQIGIDSLLFTTDHPHYDFDHPGAVLSKYFSHLSDSDLAQLLSGNARELYGI